MKNAIFAALLALTPATVFADATSDANFIVKQTVNRDIFEGALSALRPVIMSAVENDLRKGGVEVSNVDGYMDIVMEEFMDGYVTIMQEKTVPYYLETFSEEHLSAIAEFYASEAGREVIGKTPELMQFGAKVGATAGQEAFLASKSRVRQRLIDEDIDITSGDKSMMQKLLDALK